jgi:hypothetical protein
LGDLPLNPAATQVHATIKLVRGHIPRLMHHHLRDMGLRRLGMRA